MSYKDTCTLVVVFFSFVACFQALQPYAKAQIPGQIGSGITDTTIHAANSSNGSNASNPNQQPPQVTQTNTILVTIVGAISGGAVTYFTAVQKNKTDKILAIQKANDDKDMAIQKANHDKDMAIQQHKYQVDEQAHRSKLEMIGNYDIDLRTKRTEAYRGLWSKLDLLRKHAVPINITYERVQRLLEDLTYWYYEEGSGMFLSEQSRDLFFEFLEMIEKGLLEITENNLDAKCSTEFLGDFPDKRQGKAGLRRTGSELRTRLLEDIGTRKQLTGITY
jgi:hypothetical protein